MAHLLIAMPLSKTELAALNLLIAVKEEGLDAPTSLDARFTPAVLQVTRVATRYTPAAVNLATNFIGVRARGLAVEEIPDFDSLSLEDLIDARDKALSGQ
jgi:hypothetical protein